MDHFIFWFRYPADLGHNFVLADQRCNNAKRDRIAAYDHLCEWVERNQEYGEQLAAEFRGLGVMHDLTASVRIAHWAYAQTETANGLTWLRAEEMISLPQTWRTSLGKLQAPAG